MPMGLRKIMSVFLTVFMMLGIMPVNTFAEGDTTPPAFVEGYPQDNPQGAGSRRINIVIKAQEPCFYSVVMLPNGADAPSKEQVRDRRDADGQPADWWTDRRDTPITDTSVSLLVPQHSTDYDVYVVLLDAAGNLSEPEKLDVISPPPGDYFALGYPQVGAVQANGSNQVAVKLKLQNTDEGANGRVYIALLPDGAAEPSVQQVYEGKDGNGNAAVYTSGQSFTPDMDHTVLVTGATGGTDYDLYLVADDAGAVALAYCTDVIKLNVTTPPDIPGNVCKIGETGYATLQAAVDAADYTPTTIMLLKGFTTVQGLVISGKQITLALNGYTVNIDNPGTMGLQMQGGTLALSGEGELNVKGSVYGLWANGGTATVTNAASGVDSAAIGVYAQSGAQVAVRENASGSAHGVKAQSSATKVTVNGDVSNTQMEKAVNSSAAEVVIKGDVNSDGDGVYANTGKVTVEGNVNAVRAGVWTENIGTEVYVKGNLHANSFGIILSGSGSVTVDGEITLTSPLAYIRLSSDLEKEDGVPDAGKPGYLKYSALGSPGVVWVKAPVANVCEIDGTGYATLDAALNTVGTTFKVVKLLQTIDDNDGLIIDNKKITFDLNGHNLNVSNPLGFGLIVTNGGRVEYIGNGQFNVSGKSGVSASTNLASVRVTSVTSTDTANGVGAEVRSGNGSIIVEGDISAVSTFIRIGSVNLSQGQGISDPGKGGFLKFSGSPGAVTGAVWVKGYDVTVSGGTATSSRALKDGTITITADAAPSGRRFKEWSITPAVTFVEGGLTSATAKFTMPAQAVTVEAVYEAIPAAVDSVTANPSSGGGGRNSLSTYGADYKAPVPAFSDIANHWAKDNIDFVVSRGLLSGTGASTFSPNTSITRADFLMALGKLSGADMSVYKTSGFTDVKSMGTAMPYIEWAVKNGIVQGIGGGKFGPDMQITREQMAVMMVNYVKATNDKLPVSQEEAPFADDAKIGSWASAAVKDIRQAGIIVGKSNNLFDPQGSATRAEASTILRRFVESVVTI